MGKQRIVVKVWMGSAKRHSKALKIAVGLPGVLSAALEGDERDQIVVVGEGVDSIALAIMLRKHMGFAELVRVAPVDEKKEEKAEGGEAESMAQSVVCPYHESVVQPYVFEVQQGNNYDPCRIM